MLRGGWYYNIAKTAKSLFIFLFFSFNNVISEHVRGNNLEEIYRTL